MLVRIDESEARQAVAGSEAAGGPGARQSAECPPHYERTKQLLAQKFISQAALDKAQADYKAAEAQLAAAQAGAGQAATTRGFTAVMAPYSGVVAARHVELGEMASPGKALMTGFDPKDLRVVASIPQYKLADVRRAARAQVNFPRFNKWVTAKAVTLLPAADAKTHTTRVRLDLPEDIRDVYPGMFARAHLPSAGRRSCWCRRRPWSGAAK